jgi:hypothetical protein
MSGDIPLLPLYVFMACTGTILPFSTYVYILIKILNSTAQFYGGRLSSAEFFDANRKRKEGRRTCINFRSSNT